MTKPAWSDLTKKHCFLNQTQTNTALIFTLYPEMCNKVMFLRNSYYLDILDQLDLGSCSRHAWSAIFAMQSALTDYITKWPKVMKWSHCNEINLCTLHCKQTVPRRRKRVNWNHSPSTSAAVCWSACMQLELWSITVNANSWTCDM